LLTAYVRKLAHEGKPANNHSTLGHNIYAASCHRMEANLLTEVCDMKQQHVNCHIAKTQLLMFEVILNPEIIFTSF